MCRTWARGDEGWRRQSKWKEEREQRHRCVSVWNGNGELLLFTRLWQASWRGSWRLELGAWPGGWEERIPFQRLESWAETSCGGEAEHAGFSQEETMEVGRQEVSWSLKQGWEDICKRKQIYRSFWADWRNPVDRESTWCKQWGRVPKEEENGVKGPRCRCWLWQREVVEPSDGGCILSSAGCTPAKPPTSWGLWAWQRQLAWGVKALDPGARLLGSSPGSATDQHVTWFLHLLKVGDESTNAMELWGSNDLTK